MKGESDNFTPQVRVNETVVIGQNTPIPEVATVSREVFIDTAQRSGPLEESRASVEARIREIVERNRSTVLFRQDAADRRLS
jgi:hypothetical protein